MMRTLLINLAVLSMLLMSVVLLPPAVHDLVSLLEKNSSSSAASATTPEHLLPPYAGLPWAGIHFAELRRLQYQYEDFVVWRGRPFHGETIRVTSEGFRVHDSAVDRQPAVAVVWLFGGSTMWGSGANDAGTIPALLEQHSGLPTFNFGEAAYTAHQSLNLLMQYSMTGHAPKHVVFYDGVNEVMSHCRVAADIYASTREDQIRGWIPADASGAPSWSTLDVFRPTINLLAKGFERRWREETRAAADTDLPAHGTPWDCHADPAKAAKVADALLTDWENARSIVERMGGTFHAVLQPVGYVGTPELSYLPEVTANRLQGAQYRAVYEAIRVAAERRAIDYLDLTRLYDGDQPLYIDFCHVSPAGNERVARILADRLGAGTAHRDASLGAPKSIAMQSDVTH